MKKLLSILLSACLLCTVFAFTASAETHTGTCGDNVTWSLVTSSGILTIAGEGEMQDFESSYNPGFITNCPFFPYRNSVTSVCIENSVTKIGGWSFVGQWLNSLTIPGNIKSIGNGAFWSCVIPELILSEGVERIEASAFDSCNLVNVFLPDSLTYIADSAFRYAVPCQGSTEIIFHCNLDTYAYNWVTDNGFKIYDPNPIEPKWWETQSTFVQWLLRIFLFGWIWMN